MAYIEAVTLLDQLRSPRLNRSRSQHNLPKGAFSEVDRKRGVVKFVFPGHFIEGRLDNAVADLENAIRLEIARIDPLVEGEASGLADLRSSVA